MGTDYKLLISENITKLLQERGLTQQDLADHLGVNKSTVSGWCSGKKTPRMDKVEDMAKFFNCSVTDILGYTKPDPVDYYTDTDAFRDRMKDEYGVLFDLADKADDHQLKQIESIIRTIVGEDE